MSFDRSKLPGASVRARTEALNSAEFALVAHVRGWCHDSADCVLCTAQTRAWKAEQSTDEQIVRLRASLRTSELRRVDAEVTTAYLARDLTEARENARFWMERAAEVEHTLDSIIEG